MAKVLKTQLHEIVTRNIDSEGEVINTEIVTKYNTNEQEPPFLKLYIDFVLTIKDISKSLNPILIEFLKRMSWANITNDNGGQIIYINKAMKEDIQKTLGLKSIERINQSLTQFVKSEIFFRLASGKYQVNPYIFGKGEWKDIRGIRTTIEFKQFKDENSEITYSNFSKIIENQIINGDNNNTDE